MNAFVLGSRPGFRSLFVRVFFALLMLAMVPAQAAFTSYPLTAPAGLNPASSGLILASDGNYYGTSSSGGATGQGTVYRMTPAGVITTIASLGGSIGTNASGLIQATDGNFYGTVQYGGVAGVGAILKVSSAGTISLLASLTNTAGSGRYPQSGVVQGADGNFYGTTADGGASNFGTFFRVTPSGAFSTLASFDNTVGAYPHGLVQGNDGNFYGAASSGGPCGWCGTIFRVTPAGAITVLVGFNNGNGAQPYGTLIKGINGNFYGTTTQGGTYGAGTVFQVSSTGVLTTIAAFNGTNGRYPYGSVTEGSDGFIYGVTAGGGANDTGVFYQVSPTGGMATLLSFTSSTRLSWWGPVPPRVLETANGDFYAVKADGGSANQGGVYRLSLAGDFVNVASFYPIGAYPQAALIQGANGNFYGTTQGGGQFGQGAVVQMTPAGVRTTFASFDPAITGANPQGSLLLASDGNYYGTAAYGGANNYGAVFRMTPSGALTAVVSFDGSNNGAYPSGALVAAADGKLYGTTVQGGANNVGTVFQVTTSGVLTTLVSFDSTNGSYPRGDLAKGADGNFYGTTEQGGSNNYGTVYRITPQGAVTTLVSFNGSTNGSYPESGLLRASDGNFYGTTNTGGTNAQGTVFRMTPAGALIALVSFNGTNGARPRAPLMQGADGNLYGTTETGTGNSGTVFQMTPTGVLTTLVSFGNSNGASPQGSLVQATDGNFYGTTYTGGNGNGFGVFFRLDGPPAAPSLSISAGSGYAQLTWNAVANATSYNVYVSTAPHAANPDLLQRGITGTMFTANGLATDGTTYYFTVRAVNDPVAGAPSNEVNTGGPTSSLPPVLSMSLSSTSIYIGQSATVNWSSNNATACTASNAWSGSRPTSGSANVTPTTTGSFTYQLTCTGVAGTATGSVTLTVSKHTTTMTASGVIRTSPSPVAKPSATLTDSVTKQPLQGLTVRFVSGGQALCSGVTNSAGLAQCSVPVSAASVSALKTNGYNAFFDGTATYAANKVHGTLTVTP